MKKYKRETITGYNMHVIHIYPTLPLGQDITQGQFLGEV